MASGPKSRKKQTIVLKLSGRLFFSGEFDAIAAILRKVLERKKNLRIVAVAGGGRLAREYIQTASQFGADQASLDGLGICASRLNALVLVKALGKIAVVFVPRTLEELVEVLEVTEREKQIAVIGGLNPGQSTNAVGALVAEKLRANTFINATDVEGVYTKDPRKFKDAKKLSKLTTKQLSELLKRESMKAGGYDLMDPIALKLIERSKIRTRIIKCDESTLSALLINGRNVGTRIVLDD